MAEPFGILASAAQLASYCAGIWRLMQDIKGSTSSLQKYQREIKELQSLSESIAGNEIFHTSDIRGLVQSILTAISLLDLTALLQKPRIYRTWVFLIKKGDLLDLFDIIEKKKSSLALHMHLVQAETLNDIKTDISTMNEGKSLQKRKTTEKVTAGWEVIEKSEVSYVRAPLKKNKIGSLYQEHDEDNNGVSLYQPLNNSTTSNVENSEAQNTANESLPEFGKFSAVFLHNEVTGPGDQINGGLIEGQQVLAIPDTSRVFWGGNTKSSVSQGGAQVNGLKIVPCEDPTQEHCAVEFSHLQIKGHYIGNTISGTGSQTNGFHIRRQEQPKR